MNIHAKQYYGIWRISDDITFSVIYDNGICQCNVVKETFTSFIFNSAEAVQVFHGDHSFNSLHFNCNGSAMAIGGMTGITMLFALFIPGLFFCKLSDPIKNILTIHDHSIVFSKNKEQEIGILIDNGEIKEFIWKNCDVYTKAVPLFQYGQYDISAALSE